MTKSDTSDLFFIVIWAMLIIAIKDLKLCINNPYLLMRKSAICFDPSSQKKSSDRN